MLGRFPRRAEARLFVALSVVATSLAAVAVIGSLSRVGVTFPGFVVWDNLVVVALGRPGWTGIEADVPFRSKLIEIDGVPIRSRGALRTQLSHARPGTEHRYKFVSATGSDHRTLRSMTFTWGDWVATMGVYAINGLAFLVTGLAVFYLKPDSPESRAVLAFGMIWGLTLLLAIDLFTKGYLQSLYFVVEALSPCATLHLALLFPTARLRSARALVWIYGIGLVVGVGQSWMFQNDHPALLAVNDAVYLTLAAAGIAAIVAIATGAFTGSNPRACRRARVVLAGAITAFGIPLLALLAFFLSGEPVSFSLLALTGFLFPISIGYAVARHDLFEADRFVKLSLVYGAITLLVSLAYAASILVADRLASGLAIRENPLFPIAFVLVALATIVPLRERVQNVIDRLFYRSRVDYKRTIAAVSERMTTLLDRNAIVEHVQRTLREVLHLERVGVWERVDGALVRRQEGEPFELSPDVPGIAILTGLDGVLSLNEAQESAVLRPHRESLERLFATLEATVIVPLLHHGRSAGLLAVGSKVSGGPLSSDDLDVLRTLANETAVALATAAAVEQLNEAQQRLARSDRLAAIGELSAAVAHGIRNPLASIRLAAQIGLETVVPSDAVRENLDDVLAEVDKLDAQVRGILDFARPFEPRLEPLSVNELVDDVLRTLAPRSEARHVAIQSSIEAGLPDVLGDKAHLTQALHELIANALDATGESGHIAIEATRGPRAQVRVAVSDSGPGVRPEIRERIFQLFSTTKKTGTGVGLAVVRKIVDRHGGSIELETTAPEGARFVLSLPSVPAAHG